MILLLDIFGEHILGFLAGTDYLAGTVVILPLACGLAVVFLGSETSIGLAIKKRMVFRLYCFIIYLVCGLLAIFIFGNYFGMLGVAYGTLVGQLLLGASLFLFAKRISGISWNTPPVMLFCVVFLALGFSRTSLMDSESLFSLVLQALVIVTACLLVGYFLLFARSDRALAMEYLRNLRR
jgi:O-antigen/teichoic acid export membrane protein